MPTKPLSEVLSGDPLGYRTALGCGTAATENVSDLALLAGATFTGPVIVDYNDAKLEFKDAGVSKGFIQANGADLWIEGSDQLELVSTNGVGIAHGAAYRLNTTGTGLILSGVVSISGDVTANNLSGTNTGDQTSIVGITGTLSQFNSALTGADFVTGGGTATGTNTGDQTSVSGNAGTATALATPRTISITGKGTAAGGTFDGTGNLALNITAVTLVAGDIPNIAESQVTNLTSDLALKAPLASPVHTGNIFFAQPTPTAKSASATLTIAELLTGIITATSASAVTLTLPTGTNTDAGILSGALSNDRAFEWGVINLGSSSGAVTMAAGTGHTYVGATGIPIATSARFRTRKTATNTFVTYRI